MKFIPLKPSLAQQWDYVAQNSDDAWLFHLYDWLPLTEQHWNLESKSFLLEYEGKVIGIFPLQLNRKSKSLKSTYMGLGGAALLNGLQEGVRKKALKAMYEQVYLIASECQSPFIEILLNPLSESALNDRWQINPLVSYFYEDTSSHTWMLDLSISEDEILNNYSDDTRRMIRKASLKNYKIEQLTKISEIDNIYEIHCENRERTKVPVHPKDFFFDFYSHICAKNLAVIWKAVDSNGRLVAFEVTGLFKKGALYWMGSSNNDCLEDGVNYLLQHHAIMWAKQQGLQWFENGEAFPNIQEGKMHGLTVFKGKFGGHLHRLFKGKITMNHPGRIKHMVRISSNFYNAFIRRR